MGKLSRKFKVMGKMDGRLGLEEAQVVQVGRGEISVYAGRLPVSYPHYLGCEPAI